MPNSLADPPLVSIVIPCWNGEGFVGEAIESALAQTYENTEVIVINDGSTDDSIKVIRSFDGFVRWESGPNQGACAARNLGVAISKGKLLQFLDADDVLYPRKLEEMVPLALQGGENHLTICDWTRSTNESGGRSEIHETGYRGQDPIRFCLEQNIQTSAPLHWKSNFAAVGGFDETLPCCQEYDLHFRLAVKGIGLSYLNLALFEVRSRPDSLSSNELNVLMVRQRVLWNMAETLERVELSSPRRRSAIAEALTKDGRKLIRLGHSDLAGESFDLAKRVYPN